MLGQEGAVAPPESRSHRYRDAAAKAKDPMRRALLHERAARCLLEEGQVAESLQHAKRAYETFRDGVHPSEAHRFKARFMACLRSNSIDPASLEFLTP